jgi:hypothetical protein
MADEQDPSQDPLGLDAIDRDIRINELHEKVKDLGMTSFHASEDCPPDVHEEFLQSIVHLESGQVSSRFAELESAGVELPPPDSLDDTALFSKLWEVINALACQDAFLYHTDHLSDRQLYEELWTDTLREETTIMPPGSGWRCHIDLIGSGSEEDIEIGLRYYDSEEERQSWARDFPGDVIPPQETAPYDRDRHLPQADACDDN